MDFLKSILPFVHKEGFYFIIIFLVITLLLSLFSKNLTIIGLILSVWCVFFFRDPERVTPLGDELIISPADGVIQKIEKALPPKNLKMDQKERIRVSIFLDVFNVHVNRVPVSGKVKKLYYHPGKFFNASLDKASIYNERQEVLVEMKGKKQVAFSQIAGLIARRIVCDLKEGQEVSSGERFGIIRFGSRMDVYLPVGVNPLVSEGQTVIGGETLIADLNKKEGRKGEVR
jgi:phosphatidylserine decarboxylase